MESFLSFKFKHIIRFFILLIFLSSLFLLLERFLVFYLYEKENVFSNLLKFPFARGGKERSSFTFLIIIVAFWSYLGWILCDKLKQYFIKLKKTPFNFATAKESFLLVILLGFLYIQIRHIDKFQTLGFFQGDFMWFWIFLFSLGFLTRHIFEKSAYKKASKETENKNLLAEKPISSWDEDLLDRRSVINNLTMEINESFNEGGGVVACFGTRGMGKTSVLNLLKKDLKLREFKLVYFQPWRYKHEREMVSNFFGTITKFLTRNYNLPFINNIPQKFTDLILGLPKVPFVDFSKISEFLKYESDYDVLKFEIENALIILKVRIIMIIDDLDRCSSKDIFLLLRLFNIIGNFKNVVYLVSADLDEISRRIETPNLVELI